MCGAVGARSILRLKPRSENPSSEMLIAHILGEVKKWNKTRLPRNCKMNSTLVFLFLSLCFPSFRGLISQTKT